EILQGNIPGERKAALDLGCGSGTWITELAGEYPHIAVVGVDLVPGLTTMHVNCRIEVDGLNLGLEHFYGDFNVVHVRLISPGIRDYFALIDQISRVLREEGLFDVMECDFNLRDLMPDGNHKRLEHSAHEAVQPWLGHWLALLRAAVRDARGCPDAATDLQGWITSHPAFDRILHNEY
ncbi:hypothetical protein B0H13DRAFT_1522290, partial [Mycena leptocephala]